MVQDIQEIKRLYASIGKLITSTLDLEEILEQIMVEVETFFSPLHWSLLRVDPNSDELFFLIVRGIDPRQLKDIRLSPGEGIAGYVASHRQSLCISDVARDPRFSNRIDKLTGFQTGSILAVPVIYLDTLYGVIEIVKPAAEKTPYSEDDRLVMETIADFAAIAFANSTAFSILVDLSEMDTLTGFYNQNKLEKTMVLLEDSQHHMRSREGQQKVVVVFLDLDHFKKINDTYGHSVGDRVLREFSRRLRSAVRNNDMIFRIGGDEFLFFIVVEDDAKVVLVQHRLEKEFQTMNPFVVTGGIEANFSWGMIHGPTNEVRKLVHQSDMLMYQKKHNRKS